jgi:hypothetical protein
MGGVGGWGGGGLGGQPATQLQSSTPWVQGNQLNVLASLVPSIIVYTSASYDCTPGYQLLDIGGSGSANLRVRPRLLTPVARGPHAHRRRQPETAAHALDATAAPGAAGATF